MFINTIIRRALQPLWSSLDRVLGPEISHGIVIAVSGGPDSRALLESLARWPGRLKGQIVVACFDHAQRHQSDLESKLVFMRAKYLGFSAHHEKFLSPKGSGEKELRELRYKALKNIAYKFGCKNICTAHHRDDNSEGFLMALLGVGGGSYGAAMAVRERLPICEQECELSSDLFLLRPFLKLSKNQLLLALNTLAYTDYALDNLDIDRQGQRAYVRHEVLPELSRHARNISERLDVWACKQLEQQKFIAERSAELIKFRSDKAEISLEGADSASLSQAVRQVLSRMCPTQDLRQSRPTLEKLLKFYLGEPGLDRSPKWFNVRYLNAKEFYFPGAVLKAHGAKIVIQRVLANDSL